MEMRGNGNRRKSSIRTAGKTLLSIVLLLAVVAGFTLFTLRPYLYDTRVRQLQKNVDLLSWELDN